MDSGLGELRETVDRLGAAIERVPRQVGHAVGKVGKEEVNRQAVSVFGGDKKFSGARTSRKARRAATVRYSIFGDRVEVYPSGDPWYIFVKGRGRSNIVARKAK